MTNDQKHTTIGNVDIVFIFRCFCSDIFTSDLMKIKSCLISLIQMISVSVLSVAVNLRIYSKYQSVIMEISSMSNLGFQFIKWKSKRLSDNSFSSLYS